MNGQWIGSFTGTNSGTANLNIEFVDDQYEGQAVLADDNPRIPSSIARVSLQKIGENAFQGSLSKFQPINKVTSLPDAWESIKNQFDPNTEIPHSGILTAQIKNTELTGGWKTDIDTKGSFKLTKSDADQPSAYHLSFLTWTEFKELVSKLEHGKFIFRGQSGSWRLRTAFHRTGRCDLERYHENIFELQHHICAQTNRVFKLEDGIEYAALLTLGQHHGYPTPLLDWTESPFIAAYFAYSSLPEHTDNKSVRIYKLNSTQWLARTPQTRHIQSPVLSITIVKSMPIFNNRAVPQQSITTFSNVDDIESFIKGYENHYNEQYLEIIELPAIEKKEILKELYSMGINAGSLFPGLDGSCRMLKEKHFFG